MKVTTVGGTVSGLWGARAAARAIHRVSSYRRESWSLNLELTIHWLLRGLWNRFEEDDYSALLRAMNHPVNQVLRDRNRDRWFGAVLPMLKARPQLLALATSALVRDLAPSR